MEQEIEKEKLRQEKIELEKRRLQVGSVLNAKQRVSLIYICIRLLSYMSESHGYSFQEQRRQQALLSGAASPSISFRTAITILTVAGSLSF